MKRSLILLATCSICFSLVGCEEEILVVDGYQIIDEHDNRTADDSGSKGAPKDNDNSGAKSDSPAEDSCTDDKTLCRGKCVDLALLHMDDCTTCSINYCNSDKDISNGCETYVLGSDMNNCGGCGIQCDASNEVCTDGECVPLCENGEQMCDGQCVSLSDKHLESCTACAADYCDTNNNLADGCEAYVKTDNNNCGVCGNACNAGEICSDGECKPDCASDETSCGGKCVNLSNLHLSACGTCAANYCDADGNMDNGCEVSAKGNDVNNCGACGNKCASDQVCKSGSCVIPYDEHRILVVNLGGDTLNFRDKPTTSGSNILDAINEFTYLTASNEKDGWYQVEYNNQTGWISGSYAMDAGDKYMGRKAIDEAEKFLYSKNPKMCTWDFLTHEPKIQNFTDLWASYSSYNHGYNDNCANFVTAMLQTVGLISKHQIAVGSLYDYVNNKNGWKKVSFSEAKPGDIWISSGKGHTELAIGYTGSKLLLIGSNNFSSSSEYQGCQLNTGAGYESYQRVSYAYKTNGDGYLFSMQ